MKYGMRERISGIVIIVALALILLPILFGGSSDDEKSSDDSSVIIEQPIEMSQPDVAEPQSPLSSENDVATNDDISTDNTDERSGQASQSNQLFPDRERETSSSQTPARSASSSSSSRDSAAARGNGGNTNASTSASRPSTASRDNSAGSTQRQTPARSDDSSGDPIMAAANRNSHSASQPSGSGGWAVQAGSFGQPGNADRLIQQLRSQGFSAYQQPRGELNTVYVGPFSSTEESERARAELQEKANIKGLIVRREGGQ